MLCHEETHIAVIDLLRYARELHIGFSQSFQGYQMPGLDYFVHLVYELASDYIDQQLVSSGNYQPNMSRSLVCHPKFTLALNSILPPAQVDGGPLLQHYTSNYLEPIKEGLHYAISTIIAGPTWRVWGVRKMGLSLVLIRGEDYRIMEWERLTGGALENGDYGNTVY